MHVQELMLVKKKHRDLWWLRKSLQRAVELELSTLPPYLTALWSIDDRWSEAEAQITHVVKEEMLHMVLAGNMLATVGGAVPDRDEFGHDGDQPAWPVPITPPSYPTPLPGDVIPNLIVPLEKLTHHLLRDVFMVIEHPQRGYSLVDGRAYVSIGAFYAAIRDAFVELEPELSGEHQLTGTVGGHAFGPIDKPKKFLGAIDEIRQQGEGTGSSPFTDKRFGHELAHYYRFAEVFHGRRLKEDCGDWVYCGEEIPFPHVFDMAPIPKGGYRSVPCEVEQLLHQFNSSYTGTLQLLEEAWAAETTEEGSAKLGFAVEAMFQLQAPAQQLMQIELPRGRGTYGPTWQLVPEAATDAEPTTGGAPSFERDVLPLFTVADLTYGRARGIHLADHGYMSEPGNAHAVLSAVTTENRLPSGVAGDWTENEIDLFTSWMDHGCQP